MTPEQDMENVAVVAENYAGWLAKYIERLVAHVDADTPATDKTRSAMNGIFAQADRALDALEKANWARDARKGRKAA